MWTFCRPSARSRRQIPTWGPQAKFKRRTCHVPNSMQTNKSHCLRSFPLSPAWKCEHSLQHDSGKRDSVEVLHWAVLKRICYCTDTNVFCWVSKTRLNSPIKFTHNSIVANWPLHEVFLPWFSDTRKNTMRMTCQLDAIEGPLASTEKINNNNNK